MILPILTRAAAFLSLAGALAAQTPRDAADRVLAAWQAKDGPALSTLAGAGSPDPFLVAEDLLARRHDEAAAAFAEAAGGFPATAGLPALVSGVRERSVTERNAEAALGQAVEPLARAIERRDWAGAAPLATKAEELRHGVRPCITAARERLCAGAVLGHTGRWDQAIEVLKEGEALAKTIQWPRGRAALITERCRLLGHRARYPEMREALHQALPLAERVGERVLAALCRGYRAECHRASGELEAALRDAERSLRELTGLGRQEDAAVNLLRIGQLRSLQGRYPDALEAFERAAREFQALGSRTYLSITLRGQAGVHRALDQTEQALSLLGRALREAEAAADREEAANALIETGKALNGLGRYSEGVGALERAWKESEAVGDREGVAHVLLHLGVARLELGELDRARPLLERCRAHCRELGLRFLAGPVLTNLGVIQERSGRSAEALDLFRAALRELEVGGDRRSTWRCVQNLGVLHLKRREWTEALREATRAREMCVEMCRGLGESGALGLRRMAWESASVGLGAVEKLSSSGTGDPAPLLHEALRFVESGRALLLAEGLINRGRLLEAKVSPALLKTHAAARLRVEELETGFRSFLESRSPEAAAVASLRRELAETYGALEQAVAQIERAERRTAELVYPRTIEPGALRELVPEGTALVLFHGRQRLFALVATSGSLRLAQVGTGTDVPALAETWLGHVSARSAEEAKAAAQLYDALLRPLEELLPGTKRLLISPDVDLAYLPFEALLRSEGPRSERAVERWEIAYVPSATVIARLREDARTARRGEGLLALGDPDYGAAGAAGGTREAGALERLPGSGEEVRAIAALFPEGRRTVLLRQEATLGSLRGALGTAEGRLFSIHLACHGLVNRERPRLTALAFSGRELLRLDDLYGLRFPSELAVLSACGSGQGKLQVGEGVIGLVRGFFYAGCPRVVVANWRVSDESTRHLMEAFYRRMLADGLAPAAALREAKLEMLRAGDPRAHPWHWAGFVLWGLPY
jgi:CHAT domain-containing protein